VTAGECWTGRHESKHCVSCSARHSSPPPAEPIFVDVLRSPGIDSRPGGSHSTTLFVVPDRQATLAGGVYPSESIPGLLKRLQIRSLDIFIRTGVPMGKNDRKSGTYVECLLKFRVVSKVAHYQTGDYFWDVA
jgi:hypothetical protein